VLKSTFEGFAPKDAAWKLIFLHTLFLENKVQISKNNIWNDTFYVKTNQSDKMLRVSP